MRPVPVTPDAAALAVNASLAQRDQAVAFVNAAKLGLSLVATWTLAFVVRFQVPRYLGPVALGDYSYAEAFAGAFFAFAELGIDTYVIREVAVRPKHASDFLGGILAIRVALSVLFTVVIFATIGITGHSLEVQLTAVLFAAAFTVGTVGYTLAAVLQASTRIDRLAVTNVVSKLVWAAGLFACFALDAPLWQLAIPVLLSEIVRVAMLVPAVRRAVQLVLRFDWRATWLVIVAAFPLFLNSAALSLRGKLNITLLDGITVGERELGWFSATSNLAVLATLLMPVLLGVVVPLLARARARSEDEVFALMRRALEGILIVILPVTLVLASGAATWLELAFGEAFVPAVLCLQLAAPLFVLVYVATTLACGMLMLGHTWTLSAISALSVPMILGFTWAGVTWARGLGPGGEAAGAALGWTATEIVVVTLLASCIGRRLVDRRLVLTCLKLLAAVLLAGAAHLAFEPLGIWRQPINLAVYAIAVLALRAVRVDEVIAFFQSVREVRRSKIAAGTAS